MGNQQCNRHLPFPGQHYSFQGFFQTFPYLRSFSRVFKALKISTLNSRTFQTFPASVWTLQSTSSSHSPATHLCFMVFRWYWAYTERNILTSRLHPPRFTQPKARPHLNLSLTTHHLLQAVISVQIILAAAPYTITKHPHANVGGYPILLQKNLQQFTTPLKGDIRTLTANITKDNIILVQRSAKMSQIIMDFHRGFTLPDSMHTNLLNLN